MFECHVDVMIVSSQSYHPLICKSLIIIIFDQWLFHGDIDWFLHKLIQLIDETSARSVQK